MTIKQQGGIFGRNPTFNDVDVEGSLTVGGSAIPAPADTLTSSDIGVTVQGYDADTAKRDTAQTFTAKQDFVFAGGGNYVAQFQNTTAATPYAVSIKDAASSSNGYPLLIISNSAGSDIYFRVDSGTSDITAGKNIRFLSSGLGIDFSATSDAAGSTSELFDDYEEGTFTPTITSGAGSFSSITYDNARSGRYTKVGNLVHFQIKMRTDAISVGTASGAVVINGLPFTSANEQTSCSVYSQDMGGDSPITGQVQNSDTVLVVYYYSGTSYSILDVTDLATGGNSNYMFITGTYTAA